MLRVEASTLVVGGVGVIVLVVVVGRYWFTGQQGSRGCDLVVDSAFHVANCCSIGQSGNGL